MNLKTPLCYHVGTMNTDKIVTLDGVYAKIDSTGSQSDKSELVVMRDEMRDKLERLADKHMDISIEDGSTQSGQLAIKALETLAKLYGLNAPDKNEIAVSEQLPLYLVFEDSPLSAESLNDAKD